MATMTLNTAWSPAIVVGNNDKRRLISTIIITAANSFKDCTVVQMPNILASCAMPSFRTLVKPTSGAAATTSAYVTILHRSYVCPSPSSSVSTHLLGHTSETRSKCNIYRWKSALGPCSGHIYASKVRVIGSAYCKKTSCSSESPSRRQPDQSSALSCLARTICAAIHINIAPPPRLDGPHTRWDPPLTLRGAFLGLFCTPVLKTQSHR